ncbi:MAG: glycosyltransferase family 39 protein [Flavobacteriaceae bacterium]|nr:glycosyltransferase family 39 protein [Flavobacteriaceae bacterium]
MSLLQKPKHQFVFFLFIFFIINFLQSYFTRLFEDEAYYWVWSKNLAFGYFDHPPMVALWVKISSFFFDGELGVRFFSIISFTLMLIIIWKIIDIPKKQNYVWLYFLLVVSTALLNVYGFITTPDTPLLLFVALFLYAYKLFLKKESWFHVFLLGFSMAAMLYSKYHGVLVIFFVVLSNLSLLKNRKIWIAGFLGFVLFLPHLYWQYVNDFPSFRYHLMERSKKPYDISFSIMHIVNQIVIVGITFPLIYRAFFKQKTKSKFDKSLKYLVYGFIIFFFISSFSTNPQAQWTGVILIPLIILTFTYFIENEKARKWLIIIGSIQFVIILIARVFLANEDLSPLKLEPHASKVWVPILKDKTNEKPIVFVNSYRNASVYNFYTRIKTHSYSILKGRKSQYDIINSERIMQNKDVVAVGSKINGYPIVNKNKKMHFGVNINNYQTFQKVKCIIPEKEIIIKPGEEQIIRFEFINVYNKTITFENMHFIGVFQGNEKNEMKKVPLIIKDLKQINGNEKMVLEAKFINPELQFNDKLTFRIAIQFYDLFEGYQGNKVRVKIVD